MSIPPPRTPPKSLQNSKKTLSGVPGVSPEGPESSPRAPRATPERPWEVSGAPPERPWSAQRVQQSSGGLKTTLWELKKLPPEASGRVLLSSPMQFSSNSSYTVSSYCLSFLPFSSLFSLLPPVLPMATAALPPSYQRQSPERQS